MFADKGCLQNHWPTLLVNESSSTFASSVHHIIRVSDVEKIVEKESDDGFRCLVCVISALP